MFVCLFLSHKADELRSSLVRWSSLVLSLSRMSAVSISIRPWSHLYCSCDRATGQTHIRCRSVFTTGRWDFHCVRFVGDDNKSYTDRRSNFNLSVSYCQNSCQNSFLSGMFHLVIFHWVWNCALLILSALPHVWFLPASEFSFLTCLLYDCRCRLVSSPSLFQIVGPAI